MKKHKPFHDEMIHDTAIFIKVLVSSVYQLIIQYVLFIKRKSKHNLFYGFKQHIYEWPPGGDMMLCPVVAVTVFFFKKKYWLTTENDSLPTMPFSKNVKCCFFFNRCRNDTESRNTCKTHQMNVKQHKTIVLKEGRKYINKIQIINLKQIFNTNDYKLFFYIIDIFRNIYC